MKFYLGYILAIGFVGFIFTKTSYNWGNDDLKTYYHENDMRFMTEWFESRSNKFHSKDADKHLINLITFISANQKQKDSVYFDRQDSLLSSLHTKSALIQSRIYTEQVYINFLKKFNTELIQNIPELIQEDIDYLDEQIEELKNALRKNPQNEVARHNLEIVIRLKQHSDFYYQKAHDISELVYKQLRNNLTSDSLRFMDKSKEYYPKQYEKSINQISTPDKKSQCLAEINDSLQSLINSKLVQSKFTETVDSIQTYDNIDVSLISKLKANKSVQEIINDFYTNDYPPLYGKTSKESLSRILKDKETNKTIQEIISKYLDKNENNQSDNKDQNDQSENNKDQQQKNNQDSKDQKNSKQNNEQNSNNDQNQKNNSNQENSKKGQNGEQKDGSKKEQQQNNKEQNGENGQGNNLDDFEKEQKENSTKSSSDHKKDQMKEGLKDLDQKKKEEAKKSEYGQQAGDDLKGTEEKKDQNGSPQPSKSPQNENSNLSQKLQQHDMTKESAEQTLKSIEQKADKYLQSRKRAGQKDMEYGTKPDW